MEKGRNLITFFNWEKLVQKSKYSTPKIILNFQKIVKQDLGYECMVGDSFILNPGPLLDSKGGFSDEEIVEYIALAAIRNYFDYRYLGNKGLPIIYCEVPISKIRSNRLLRLEQHSIKFKYEEQYGNQI